MFNLTIKGKITSKRVFDVPVIRNWKITLERREFGTKIDKFDYEIPLGFTDPEQLPAESIDYLISRDLSVRLQKVTVNGIPGLAVALEFAGVQIPGTTRTISLPAKITETRKILAWHGAPFRGITVDLEGLVYWKIN